MEPNASVCQGGHQMNGQQEERKYTTAEQLETTAEQVQVNIKMIVLKQTRIMTIPQHQVVDDVGNSHNPNNSVFLVNHHKSGKKM